MHVHLLVNPGRSDAVLAARETAVWVKGRGHQVASDEDAAHLLDVVAAPTGEFGNADLMICFGGDGTLIRGAHLCAPFGTPLLGVYYGRFGFVTQALGTEVRACISEFFDGKLTVEDRMMLRADLIRGEETLASIHALNEVVLQRAVEVRMLTFEVTVDHNTLTRYPADGVLVSTPTGSTAYNLSAGGPVIDPRIQAMILSAIAPHTLSARPLVLSADAEIVLRVTTMGDAVLSADGKSRFHLLTGDKVRIVRSDRVTRLVMVEKDDFLVKLGQRLLWSHSILGEVTE